MSIFKDTFRNYVRDQLSIRESLINIGNTNDDGSRTNRRQSNIAPLQNGAVTLPPDSYYQYTLNKQCGIRLTSLVDYVEDINLGLSSFDSLQGASLSERFILEGGTINSDISRPRPRGGLTTSDSAYGDPFIASNASPDGYGVVPMPGIIDIQIRTKTAYGSLREAKVNFECHNRKQLEVLEMLYMRPGYVALLEWGSTPYINNNGNIVHNIRLVEDELRNSNGKSDLYTNNITQQRLFNAINNLKELSSGNYDGFLGFIKNFGFQAREDGGYTCYTEMVTIGEVLESLKPPSISPFSPMALSNEFKSTSGEVSSRETGADAISVVERDAETRTYLFTSEYQKALDLKFIPEYNGLEGLTKSLLTYSTFNDFTLFRSRGATPQSAEAGGANVNRYTEGRFGGANFVDNTFNPISEDEIEKLFPEYDFEEDEELRLEEGEEIDPELQAQLDFLNGLRRYAGERTYKRKSFLEGVLRFRATTIEAALIKKLNLPNVESIQNYIIPRGGVDFPTFENNTNVGTFTLVDAHKPPTYRNDQPFIRWDALVILINDCLIPQNENLKQPINLVADRIYDEGDGKLRLDPLKFTSITELSPLDDYRIVYDFSTDPNTCILPLQFFNVNDQFIEEQLGYVPDLKVFPKEYAEALYEKNGPIMYDGKVLSSETQLLEKDYTNRIGSIFLNLNMIDYIASKNSTNTNYTVGNFVTDIWDEVNKACPNHNFVLTDDKESNCLYIIDLPVNKEDLPPAPELHEFIPFSNKNILRNFSYTSNVPSALSSTIAIQAQDPRSIQDIDGVTFAAFNRAIKNRLFSVDTESTWVKTQADINREAGNYYKKRSLLQEELFNYRYNFFSDLVAQANDQDLKGGNIGGILKEYQQMSTYVSEAKNLGTSFTSVIPLEFNATLDGISGIVIGNLFKVQKDRLPRAYAKTDIGFIVFNEEQKITAGGDWTTDISGKMVILDSDKKKLPIRVTPITNEVQNVIFGTFPDLS